MTRSPGNHHEQLIERLLSVHRREDRLLILAHALEFAVSLFVLWQVLH